jgi:hypothetical protein
MILSMVQHLRDDELKYNKEEMGWVSGYYYIVSRYNIIYRRCYG